MQEYTEVGAHFGYYTNVTSLPNIFSEVFGYGFFKKIKDAFKKTGRWIKDKVAPVAKKVANTAVKYAPIITGAIGTATGNPLLGAGVGTLIKGIGGKLGLGNS